MNVLGIHDYTSAISMIEDPLNDVWRLFSGSYREMAEKRIRAEKKEVTEEALQAELREILLGVDHPVHRFLHVYKCKNCPEFHRVEMDCYLIFTALDDTHTMAMNPGVPVYFHNVTLAFPQECQSADGMKGQLYHVRESIPRLRILTDGQEGLIFVLPEMSEVATTPGDVITH